MEKQQGVGKKPAECRTKKEYNGRLRKEKRGQATTGKKEEVPKSKAESSQKKKWSGAWKKKKGNGLRTGRKTKNRDGKLKKEYRVQAWGNGSTGGGKACICFPRRAQVSLTGPDKRLGNWGSS